MLSYFMIFLHPLFYFFFFFNDTATTEIYTLSLHDALPISAHRFDRLRRSETHVRASGGPRAETGARDPDAHRGAGLAGGSCVDAPRNRHPSGGGARPLPACGVRGARTVRGVQVRSAQPFLREK